MNRAGPLINARMKRQRNMVTPEGVLLPITIGSRAARVAALLIDFFILFWGQLAIIFLLAWIFSGLNKAIDADLAPDGAGATEFLFILFILLLFLTRYGYFLIMELSPRGATWGKRLTGVRIAARDGGRLTAEAVIARNLLRDIELFMPLIFLSVAPSGEAGMAGLAGLAWFLIFMAFPFFNKDALRAGDIIAGTWVVEVPRTKLADTLSTQGAVKGTSEVTGAKYQFGEAELSIYGEHELQTLERILREGHPDAIAAVHKTICGKLGWNPGEGDERAFLEAYYGQLRARLEADLRFGKRKRDKFS